MSASRFHPFFFVVACLVFIAGLLHIVDPNFVGLHGYTENHTLGRLIGWVATMGSLAVLLLQSNALAERQEKTWSLDVGVIGLGVLAIGSGLVGSILGTTLGLFNTIDIQDKGMRLLEGVYVVAGIGLLITYGIKRTALLRFLFDDVAE